MQIKREFYTRVAMLAAVSVLPLLGQVDRGVITGTVTDGTGAVVPGAEITTVQKSTNASYKTLSSTSGNFTVPALPVGSYVVKVEKQGFKTSVTQNVDITPGTTVRVDVKLEIGTTEQSIEVTCQCGDGPNRERQGVNRCFERDWWMRCRFR